MAKFAIPRTITFERFGEKYAKSELTFRAIPTEEFAQIDTEMKKIEGSPDDKSMEIMIGVLEKYFIKGTFYDLDSDSDLEVEAEDMGKFPSDVMLACYEALTGTRSDPKDEEPLTK